MNALAQFSAVAGLTLAAAGTTWLVRGRPTSPPIKVVVCDKAALKDDEICLADVPDDVLWIDARLRGDWERNGLKGSILWNMDPNEDVQAFEAAAASRIFESEAGTVIVYCTSEACGTSRIIADRIRELQLGPTVKILFGGWDALKDSVLINVE